MKIDKNVEKSIEYIKKLNENSSDIVTRTIDIKNTKVAYIYLESVASDDKVSDFLVKNLSNLTKDKKNIFENIFNTLKNTIYNSHLGIEENFDNIFYLLSSGYTCIFIDGYDKCITIETKASLDRGVSEATTETVVRGPKDSFTENNATNIGLIRKRIKDPNLIFNETLVGRRSKTKVTLSYIKDIVDEKKVKNIKKKLEKIDIDGIIDSGYLRSFIIDKQSSSFPKLQSTERPDLASTALLNGKIVILVENSPFVLITPSLLVDFIHNPEDNYQKTSNVNLTRLLRLFSFFLTVITPGLYIALTTYNPEIIPDKLLISIAIQQEGVPFPTAFAIIIMIIIFEILRESDIRIPNAMGAAVSIVGALVLGEAAVSAGIVSPIVIIVVAITSISGLLFTDIDFINAIRLWRFIFIFFAMLAGLIGIIIAVLIFTIRLCELEENGLPYLIPISPIYFSEQKNALIKIPTNKSFFRPSYLTKKNQRRMSDNK